MPSLGTPEIVIICVICLILFGGRVGRLGTELGEGIRNFRKGITDDEAD